MDTKINKINQHRESNNNVMRFQRRVCDNNIPYSRITYQIAMKMSTRFERQSNSSTSYTGKSVIYYKKRNWISFRLYFHSMKQIIYQANYAVKTLLVGLREIFIFDPVIFSSSFLFIINYKYKIIQKFIHFRIDKQIISLVFLLYRFFKICIRYI